MRDPNSDAFLVIRTLTGHTREVRSLTFISEDELITGSNDKTIRVCIKTNEGIWKLNQVLTEHKEEVCVVAKNSYGKIASGGGNGELIMWHKKDEQ